MDWDRLRVFHAVAEAGSFTHAGEVLNLSQSAVSRQVGALEEGLNVQLFHRHARGLILTEPGELLYRTARDVFTKLGAVETQLRESKDKPAGSLKVTSTVAFGSIWLTPRIKEFLETYPEISLTIVLDDEELDLSMREADVAIRMKVPTRNDLVHRHLLTMHHKVFTSPDYIKKYGIPANPEDLDNHRLITFGDVSKAPVPEINWILEAGATKPRQPILRVNNVYGIVRAVQSGLGIAALPEYLTRETGNLVQILPELRGPIFDAYFVYPEEMRNSKKVTVFRDFILRKLAESRG